MPKYQVTVQETVQETYVVDAEDATWASAMWDTGDIVAEKQVHFEVLYVEEDE